MGNKNGDVIEI